MQRPLGRDIRWDGGEELGVFSFNSSEVLPQQKEHKLEHYGSVINVMSAHFL